MEAVAAVRSTVGIVRILDHMGLPGVAPAVQNAGPPPQTELPFEDCGIEPHRPHPTTSPLDRIRGPGRATPAMKFSAGTGLVCAKTGSVLVFPRGGMSGGRGRGKLTEDCSIGPASRLHGRIEGPVPRLDGYVDEWVKDSQRQEVRRGGSNADPCFILDASGRPPQALG